MPNLPPNFPTLLELYDKLGYSNSCPGRRLRSLLASMDEWRDDYTDEDGTKGKDLNHWELENGNTKLRTMAEKFLDSPKGYGKRLWPSNSSHTLEYPKDMNR